VINIVVSIGDIVPVNGYGCSKVRRTVVIKDTQKRIYINKDITPLQSFRKSYEANIGYNASEFKIEIHHPDSHIVTPAEFMQETYFVLYATIYSIEYENGWAYTLCKVCNTKVTPIQTKVGSSSRNKKQLWHCKNHGETYAVVSSGSTQVVIFDNNVYKMTNLSAWKIMEEQGMDANQYFPDDLNQIIGKQYLFKIKYSQFTTTIIVMFTELKKVTEDVERINYFKNGFVKYENERDDYILQNEQDDHTSPSVEINEPILAGKDGATHCLEIGKQESLQMINSLVAHGMMNIDEALKKGSKVMTDRKFKSPVSSMIFLSDAQELAILGKL
nr:replication protein A 70 kDa DNA-binding subunit B [Tanacetum cinerariifolium]